MWLFVVFIYLLGTFATTKFFCNAEQKQNWCNNKFFNQTLPALWTLMIFVILGFSFFFLVNEKKEIGGALALLDLLLMVMWKSTWFNLERLSLRQREHYGLQGYSGSLSDMSHEQLINLSKQNR